MGEDFAAPGPVDEIIMLQDAAMGLQVGSGGQADDEDFVGWADQLDQVARLCGGSSICVLHKGFTSSAAYITIMTLKIENLDENMED